MSIPAGTIAWDFQSATTPLVSKVGATETWVPAKIGGGSVTVSEANGIELDTNGACARLQATNGGTLTYDTRPFWTVSVFRAVAGDSTYYGDILSVFETPGESTLKLWNTSIIGPSSFGHRILHEPTDSAVIGTGGELATEIVLLTQLRDDGETLIRNGSTIRNVTGSSRTALDFITSDYWRMGSRASGSNAWMHMYGAGILPGDIDSGDIAAIMADWRVALGISTPPSGPSAAALRRYRREQLLMKGL